MALCLTYSWENGFAVNGANPESYFKSPGPSNATQIEHAQTQKPTVHGDSLSMSSWVSENFCVLKWQRLEEFQGVCCTWLPQMKMQPTKLVPVGSPCSRARSSPLSTSCTSSPAKAGFTVFSWRRCCFLSSRSFKMIFKSE